MNRVSTYLIVGLFWTLAVNSIYAQGTPYRVMTFNIRYDNPGDGENAWKHRRQMVFDLIDYYSPHLVGLQEALHHQLIDLEKALPEYQWVGAGRDDGVNAGEFSAILIHRESFRIKGQGTFWLSENSRQPGIGWDAACNRVATWVELTDTLNDHTIFHFNTHFDHIGEKARLNGAKLLTDRIGKTPQNSSIILTGDFNCTEDSEPYKIITETMGPRRMIDGYYKSESKPYGPKSTWSGFTTGGVINRRIDYIFVSQEFAVVDYHIITDSWFGRFPSDHLPVVITIELNQTQ